MTKILKSPFAVPIGALIVAMISVQVGATVAKRLFALGNPAVITALRLGFSSLMMLAIWRPWSKPIRAQDRWPIIGYGVSLGFMNLMFYFALSRIPLGLAVALEFTGPLAVAVIASRRRIDFVWIVLAIAGILLLLPPSGAHALDRLGILLALGAGVCWALYIVFGQRAGAGNKGQTVTFGALIGASVVTPFALTITNPNTMTGSLVSSAILIAVLSSAIPYSLEMIALTAMPAKTFGVLMSAEPAIGAMFGFLFLSERLSALQLLAIAVIMAASIGTIITHEDRPL